MTERATAILVAALLTALPASGESIRVEFVGDHVSEDVEKTVRDALPDEDAAETQLEARRQGRRAATTVQNVLNSLGHYDPKVDLGIETTEPPVARLRIDPGPSFSLGSITVDFQGEGPFAQFQDQVRNDLPVKQGRPAIPSRVIDAERWIVNTLRQAGYPYADVRERRVFGDRDAQTISVTYIVQSGPRVRFGETSFADDGNRTKASYLNKLIPYQGGDVYTPDALSAFNSRLAETRLFNIARASLADTSSGTAETGEEIRNVEVQLSERERHTVALGASYSTSEGAGLNAEFTRRNMTGRGDPLVVDVTVAELEQSLDVTWRRPNEFGYGRGLILSTGIVQETTDAYDRQAFTIGAAFEVVKGPEFSYSYGVNAEIATEEDEYGERDLQILSVFGATRLDHTDSVLDPRSGWRANGRVEPSYTLGDESNPYVRTSGQFSAYAPFDEDRRFVLAGRVKLGTVVGANAADLPVDTRFYSGGGGSVRGYAYQSIGPRSDDGTPLGGKSVVELSLETRYSWRPKIGFVAFVDAGSVSTDEFSNFDDARYGAGLGVRYSTPAGPIRLDIAAPLNPTDYDDPVQVYISIGQAF